MHYDKYQNVHVQRRMFESFSVGKCQSVVGRATYCYRDTTNQTVVAQYLFVSLRLRGIQATVFLFIELSVLSPSS